MMLTNETRELLEQKLRRFDQERKERERMMTPKSDWTSEMQLEDALERADNARTQAQKDRKALFDKLGALKTDRSQRNLTEAGRREYREAALAAAAKGLGEYREAATLARRTLERRASLVGVGQILRAARFFPPGTDDDESTKLLRGMAEQLTVFNTRNELADLSATELATEIHEAAATGNLPRLRVAEQVVARRKAGGVPVEQLTPASSALNAAYRDIELPRDVQRLDGRFKQLAEIADDLDVTVGELADGRESPNLAAKTRRVEELTAEGLDPIAVGRQFASEKEAERAEQKQRATKVADQLIVESVTTDKLVIPISQNANPSPAD
jgi:hypothetical protein